MIRRTRSVFSLVLVVALVCLLGHTKARADSFADAREAYKEGQEFYADGNFVKAAQRYEAAFRMSRSPVLLFNVAQALRRQFQKDGDYDKLARAAKLYSEFIEKADPGPRERELAQANLDEVKALSVDEAKRRFEAAGEAMNASQFEDALREYDAAYQLSGHVAILYNIAQAERRQFKVDAKLARLARAETLIRSYRQLGGDQVDEKVIDELLKELATQREDYQRRREAQARSNESATMKQARAFYAQGDGEAALAELDKAEKAKGNSSLSLIQIYRLRGQAAAMAGKQSMAVDAFEHYLALEPAADGTGISEQAAPAFADAKEFWATRAPFNMEHLPPGTVAPKKPVKVPVLISSDPLEMIKNRSVRFRKEGSEDWTTLAMRSDSDAIELPANPMPRKGKEYKMQYYITATDAYDNQLHTLGTDAAPLAFLVSKDAIVRPPPIYKRWWFWAGTGAVVAGSIATYAIIKSGELPAPEVGNL